MLTHLIRALGSLLRANKQPRFDAAYYLSLYPDVGAMGADPYEHWIRSGRAEGRQAAFPVSSDAGPAASLSALIEDAALFDPAYYVSCYREEIEEGRTPLDHYLAIGQHRHYKPNPAFDPLVYLLRHPDAKFCPLIHYLQHRHEATAGEDHVRVVAALPGIVPPDFARYIDLAPDILDRDLQNDLTHSKRFGDSQTVGFAIDGLDYQLVAPSADAFFARLENDQPFAYPRLPHGFWDCLTERIRMRDQIVRLIPGNLFSDSQIDRLTERLCDEMLPGVAVYAENFLSELLDGILLERSSPEYQRSISFKWRPTIDDRVFGRTELIDDLATDQLRLFARYFKDQTICESMIWKRWAYSGDLKRLPPLARERPLVLVGAAGVSDLQGRWNLPWFEHVEIPLSSYTIRYEVLDRIKAASSRAKALADDQGTKRPLILLQGGSFAYWLIARLHAWDPSMFYFDLGQALHTWFVDDELLWMHWLLFHPRLIMENCELDEFYRALGISLKSPFAAPEAAILADDLAS